MTLGATLIASLLVALSTPSTWPLALAGFLVRGGVLLVLAPIVVLPTAVGLANVIAPVVEDVAFGRRTAELAVLVASAAVGLVAWLIGGGLLAAATEADLTRRVAEDDELAAAGHVAPRLVERPGQAVRILGARLVAGIPLLLVVAWGSIRIIEVAYRELTVPSDTERALILRVVVGAPEAVVAIVLAWLASEIVGAIACRHIVMLGEGTIRGVWRAIGRVVRHPLRVTVLGVLPSFTLGVVLTAMGLAGSTTWDALQAALTFDDGSFARWGLLIVFVGLFGAALVLVGVTSAWRSAVWTVDLAGTFGGGLATQKGGWNRADRSATLADPGPGEQIRTEVMDDHAVDRLQCV